MRTLSGRFSGPPMTPSCRNTSGPPSKRNSSCSSMPPPAASPIPPLIWRRSATSRSPRRRSDLPRIPSGAGRITAFMRTTEHEERGVDTRCRAPSLKSPSKKSSWRKRRSASTSNSAIENGSIGSMPRGAGGQKNLEGSPSAGRVCTRLPRTDCAQPRARVRLKREARSGQNGTRNSETGGPVITDHYRFKVYQRLT